MKRSVLSSIGLCVIATCISSKGVEFVTIGGTNITADPATSHGGVDYAYQISIHEVTIAEFQASGVGDGDEDYWNDGIRTVGTNAPATQIYRNEAMAFCNWLTSGNVSNGVYQLNGANYEVAVSRENMLTNTTYSTWHALPTDNEWYKAAYWDADQSSGGDWTVYPNGTGSPPAKGPTGQNYDNYYSPPNQTWTVSTGAEEQNGTYDMSGNVHEWAQDNTDGLSSAYAASVGFISRGGYHVTIDPSKEYANFGFRVVAIPAPQEPQMSIYRAVEIGYTSVSGETYQVQYSTNLVSTNWFDLGEPWVADEGTNYIFDSTLGINKRFYRVITE